MTADPVLAAATGGAQRSDPLTNCADASPVAAARIAPEQITYIGLGSNLADPQRQVEQALAELAALPLTRMSAASRLYRTTPVGPLVATASAPPRPQPDFVNAAARLDTSLTPAALLRALQQLERRHGRVRDSTRWGPRTLDLDILLYGDLVQTAANLQLPHPQLHRRAFVLVPLADIAPPTLVVPGHGCLGDLLTAVGHIGVEPLASAALLAGTGRQPSNRRWPDDPRLAVRR